MTEYSASSHRLYRELSASSGHSATTLYIEPDSSLSLRISTNRSQCIVSADANGCGHSQAAALAGSTLRANVRCARSGFESGAKPADTAASESCVDNACA